MRPYKIRFICIVAFLLANCKVPIKSDNWDEFKVPYFYFDQVEYYQSAVTEDELWSSTEPSNSNSREELYRGVIDGRIPKDLSDTLFIQKLNEFGYQYQQIPSSKHSEINDIFREKSDDPNDYKMMCMPVFNDILVFRKEHKISGIAKICFGCRITDFKGTSAKTQSFGALKGFERLRKVLRE